jgi:hypothetical protein
MAPKGTIRSGYLRASSIEKHCRANLIHMRGRAKSHRPVYSGLVQMADQVLGQAVAYRRNVVVLVEILADFGCYFRMKRVGMKINKHNLPHFARPR